MRWLWIDRIVELTPRERLVAVKHVSLSEDHMHEHFAADDEAGLAALPVMPAPLIIEGMAQSSGILVGHAGGFDEKVILAKIGRVELDADASPGDTLRYTANLTHLDDAGAATTGEVELLSPAPGTEPMTIGRIDLMFSHIDRNSAGLAFPEHNFVFGEGFRTLLRLSGVQVDF
ncbi:MAG: beta-hydroxyacyl-ACP dehydratase [Phycisphaeraceae bacterium]|nr:MAG: beta-hydroxyacyl-ACP dehydratase [Phycisphaeraceae bacterium]